MRNPNLNVESLLTSSSLVIERNDDPLVGERPDWWWTGLSPKHGVCPGVGKDGKIRSLPMLDLTHCSRSQVLDYFLNSWALTEVLFESLQGEAAFTCPPYHHLRHPLIFYYGHTACLYINKLRVASLLKEPINPYFEQLFETGVDEMSWDDMSKNTMEWPSVREVNTYRHQVFQIVKNVIETHPDLADGHGPITWDHPLWALVMGMEHERIHLETSSVLMREMPVRFLRGPAAWPDIYSPTEKTVAPANEIIAVEGGTVHIGKPADWPTYGWDNEYGERIAQVRSFGMSRFMISNGEFLEFVRAGGYHEQEFWSDNGWKWREFRNSKWPTFWLADGPAGNHTYKLRTVFEVINLPMNWPVCVNFHEAKAYLAWRSKQDGRTYRLPTEAEHVWLRRQEPATDLVMIRSGEALAEDMAANLNLACGSESPVDGAKPNERGIYDIAGNVWDWCEDDFHPLESFRVHPYYDDFSTPCFDGEHSMILGGSFMSTGDEASVWSRFHFRSHFFQHAGFHMVEPASGEVASGAILIGNENSSFGKYEASATLNQYLLLHYDSEKRALPAVWADQGDASVFPERCVDILTHWAKRAGSGFDSAIDVGCAVGRASFALARDYAEVVGIDISHNFIEVAKVLQQQGSLPYDFAVEGDIVEHSLASVPAEIERNRVLFRRADACALPAEYANFDAALGVNLLCRLPSPKAFLSRLSGPRGLIKPGGILVLASPYSWSTQFTTKSAWLGGYIDNGTPVRSFDTLKMLLDKEFELLHREDLPLVIREHARKFECIVTDVTVWRRLV